MKMLAVILTLVGLVTSAAQAGEKLALGYVNLRTVIVESKTGKQNRAQLEKLVKEKQIVLAKEEKALQALDQAFQKDQLLLTDVQKQEKQKEFQAKGEAYQKMMAEAKQSVSQKDEELTTQAVKAIKVIAADLAKERKLNLVLEVSDTTVLYADEDMDLTKQVLDRYDAKSK